MKKIKTMIKNFCPTIIACLTLVLTVNANTATCFVMYQPPVPDKIARFKKIK